MSSFYYEIYSWWQSVAQGGTEIENITVLNLKMVIRKKLGMFFADLARIGLCHYFNWKKTPES